MKATNQTKSGKIVSDTSVDTPSTPEPTLPVGTQVLVTGATGFTGVALVRRLLATGAKVRAIARHSSNISQFKDLESNNLQIEWIRGDVYDPEVVSKAMKDVEYIFHVAAAFREAKIKDEDYRNVHVVSTKLLAREALNEPKFKRFVHVSTMGVHGHIKDPPADESYRYAPGDIYQVTKLEAELWIREFAAQNGLQLSVIRPAAILGPGDKRLLKVFQMAAKPIFPILGFGKCLYHLIHVEDLVTGIILCAIHPAALNNVFICGNEEPIKLIDMAKIAANVIGNKFTVIRLPATPFFIAGAICELLCKPFGIEPPIYRRRVAFYTKDRAFNTEKIRRQLGFTPQYSNQSGIESTARWYLEHGWIKYKDQATKVNNQLVKESGSD